MTKRFGEPIPKNSNKKTKVEDDLENFWDDDLDDEALDRLATQVCEKNLIKTQQKNNVSILPSYDAFKQSSRVVISSTQIDSSFVRDRQVPGTSNRDATINVEKSSSYQMEIVDMKRRCEEKEGEATVLRNQLKQVKANLQQENEKKQHEWTDKFNQKEKQVKALKDQLDFKNLEIANLKQKVVDVVKRVNMDVALNSTQNFSQQQRNEMYKKTSSASISPKKATDKLKSKVTSYNTCHIIHSVSENVYPLKELVSAEFPLFNDDRKVNLPEVCEKSHSQNKITGSEYMIYSKFEQTMNSTKKEHWDIESIYHSITCLVNCTAEEINSDHNRLFVNKILCFTLELMDVLQERLNTLRDKSQSEEIQLLDGLYLMDCTSKKKSIQSDQLATRVGRCMYILSELLLCCCYLQDVILLDKVIRIEDNTVFSKYSNRNARMLERLGIITALIGELRMGHVWTDFQIGTAKFLTSISRTHHFSSVGDEFCKIVKQIIFSRPSLDAMPYIVDLFMTGSQYGVFVEFLCNKVSQSNIVVNLKKGTVLFNQDSCLFHVFVVLINNTVLIVDHLNSRLLKTCSRLLCFIENVLQSNCRWIYHKEEKRCECLEEFYKLSVEVIYDVLCKYKEMNRKVDCIPSGSVLNFFKSSIKILSLLAFNSYDLTEKYITVFSQYREIIHSLMELEDSLHLSENDLNDLEKLNISEDTSTISSSIINL